jgi:outer membrane protein insertion porin family
MSLEYAGLGGDFHFTRATASAAKFFPLYRDIVALMLKGRWGTINPAKGDVIPEYERFTLGGLNSIRGFRYGEVGPEDSLGNVLGGRRMVVFNTEITFPGGPIPGLYGVLFHDEGNGYEDQIDLTNLKKSYGAGIRWVTPMGPLRLEYAKVINPEPDESPSRWEFSVGTFF